MRYGQKTMEYEQKTEADDGFFEDYGGKADIFAGKTGGKPQRTLRDAKNKAVMENPGRWWWMSVLAVQGGFLEGVEITGEIKKNDMGVTLNGLILE